MNATANPVRRTAILLVAALAAALLVGLTTSAWSPASERAPLHERTHLRAAGVGIRSFAYHPQKLSIEEGTRVVFANRDSVAHTATRRGSFSTGKIRPGRSVAIRFGERGVYRYHCTIHPFMHGKVVVH
ncbi:MAG TPA: plastocyanin/azurin family copper-binding protein [Solirubrobacterales bacterium]